MTRRYVVPWLTFLLMAIFSTVFALELQYGLQPAGPGETPGVISLLSFGGLNWSLVRDGELYRMLAAPFLHGSREHLVSNGIAFMLLGYSLERQVGRAWFFCIFAAGGLAGSLLSVCLTPGSVGVGASGGIMAMMAARFLVTFRIPNSRAKMRSQWVTLVLLVLDTYPLFSGGGGHVDYGAHVGGAAFGLVVGILLLAGWRDSETLPPFRLEAAALAVAGVIGFASTGYAVVQNYPQYAPLAGQLLPVAQIPHTTKDMMAKARQLSAKYPNDPLLRMMSAQVKTAKGDYQGAEEDLRAGIKLDKGMVAIAYPTLDASIRAVYALLLHQEGRTPEAFKLAGPVCAGQGFDAVGPGLLGELRKADLCGHTQAG